MQRRVANVVVADIREDEAEEALERMRACDREAVFARSDVSVLEDVQRLVSAAESRFGALHIMTANAGIPGRGAGKRVAELPEEEFQQIMAVNFWGVVHSLKCSIDPIRRAGGGAMSVTASLAAHFGLPDHPAYVSSKHAVLGLVRSLSAALVPEIRVNAVSAGSMFTNLAEHLLKKWEATL
jgi:NAD(P)-dependent dehydrogenase (short-subunit alcohol dehydrogenase family)